MAKPKEIVGWHFTGKTLRDGHPLPADDEWLVHNGRVRICESGLHASVRVIDALQYAPGSTICRVTCRKIVTKHDDKFVCRERRIDWRIENGDEVLRAFARKAALSVIHLWDAPQVVRQYLKTGDETIRDAARVAVRDAARDAARAAARDAARDAARAAVLDVAVYAARAAAWDVARAAARDAAVYAARAAAWGAARAAVRDVAVYAARDAAWDGARAAAWGAARAAKITEFNAILVQMLHEEHDRLSSEEAAS